MKSIVFEACGDPAQVLSLADRPKPVPGRGQVLVRMIASPINPSDLMYIRGQYTMKPTLPATPGFEGVGVVEASGGGLLGRFRVGKRVAVINDAHGNWSEYTLTSARQVIPLPDEIPDEQAASLFVNPVTAVAMTKHVLNLKPGDTLLQSAAGSELGKMIIRLGNVVGFKTINLVRRIEQAKELISLGAEHVIVDGGEPLSEQVNTIAEVTHAIDAVGGETGTRMAACLTRGGRMLVYGALSGEPVKLDPRFLITTGARIEGFWLSRWAKAQSIPTMLRTFKQVKRLVQDGTFRTAVAARYPLEKIREAVEHAASPARGGKILLAMNA